MPIKIIKDEGNQKIGLWNIEEPESYFLERTHFVNPDNLRRFTHEKARKQWLASRLLLFQLIGADAYRELRKDEKGKPIADNFQLAISHSENIIAVAIDQKPIGIDIQQFNPKLIKIASKFIAAPLLESLEKETHFFEKIHVHWCVKEAMYKAYGKGGVSFIEHLHLEGFESFIPQGDSFMGYLKKPNELEKYEVFYQELEKDAIFALVTKIEDGIY